jgi:hypothetical protein
LLRTADDRRKTEIARFIADLRGVAKALGKAS